MPIPRLIEKNVLKDLKPGKVVVIYGPRQVGKTTLLKTIIPQVEGQVMSVSGEDRDVQSWLSSRSVEKLKSFLGTANCLVVDEAQMIDQVGLNLKLIVDHIPSLRVIATGSSSFELANQIGEPLVGRKWHHYLYPLAQIELDQIENPIQRQARLEERLIYGCYPEVVTTAGLEQKERLLNMLVDGYLFKDLLTLEDIRRSGKILDLLKLIAFQIGNEVSLSELSNSLDINFKTTERYLDLLEKVFVIAKVGGFSRNLRKEVTKSSRYYFYDNGIRNAIINNFNRLDSRNDVGQLWENYIFSERMKFREYKGVHSNFYFWRTYDQKEIDLVEEREGRLFGYEMKYSNKRTTAAPRDWLENYENASYKVISPDNYTEFIT